MEKTSTNKVLYLNKANGKGDRSKWNMRC